MRNSTLPKHLLYAFLGLMGLMGSCKPKIMSAENLSEYVAEPDHGLAQVKKVGDMELTLTYRPTSLIALQEAQASQHCDSMLAKAIEKYKAYYYFILELKTIEEKDPLYRGNEGHMAFSERLQKLSFHMVEYAYLTIEKDTIPLADSYFPNLYGIGGSTQVLLSFVKPQTESKEIEVVIEDMGFGFGRQKFRFDKEELDYAPQAACK